MQITILVDENIIPEKKGAHNNIRHIYKSQLAKAVQEDDKLIYFFNFFKKHYFDFSQRCCETLIETFRRLGKDTLLAERFQKAIIERSNQIIASNPGNSNILELSKIYSQIPLDREYEKYKEKLNHYELGELIRKNGLQSLLIGYDRGNSHPLPKNLMELLISTNSTPNDYSKALKQLHRIVQTSGLDYKIIHETSTSEEVKVLFQSLEEEILGSGSRIYEYESELKRPQKSLSRLSA